MQQPIISIITVTYNAAAFIEDTIKSVIKIGRKEISFIIIDGGSTDKTVEIIEKYRKHITYFVSEPDNGLYDAMNKGWAKAENNSYVLFLGAGDLIINLPDVSNLNADVIAGEVQVGNKFLFKPKHDFRLKLGNTLHHQALLIKKSIHSSAPFNTKFKTYADFDFNQRLLKSGMKIMIDPCFKGYAMEGGVSTKFNKTESLEIVKKNFGWFYFKLAQLYYLLRHEI